MFANLIGWFVSGSGNNFYWEDCFQIPLGLDTEYFLETLHLLHLILIMFMIAIDLCFRFIYLFLLFPSLFSFFFKGFHAISFCCLFHFWLWRIFHVEFLLLLLCLFLMTHSNFYLLFVFSNEFNFDNWSMTCLLKGTM